MSYEWENEASFESFEHKGFHCVIERTVDKALAGFVGVGKDHFLYGAHRGDLITVGKGPETFVFKLMEAHKGIMFSGFKTNTRVGEIRYKDKTWYFGFTCDMTGDLIPGFVGTGIQNDGLPYRNFAYVKEELKELACQLKDLKGA